MMSRRLLPFAVTCVVCAVGIVAQAAPTTTPVVLPRPPTPPILRAPPAPSPAPTVRPAVPGTPAAHESEDAWARPFFVKGALTTFTVRPLTRRNFIGIGSGVSALPQNLDTALNSFFLTVEPQIDLSNPEYKWKLGLGAPFQFQLVDTRGAFERCVGDARTARKANAAQPVAMLQALVAAAAATCVAEQKDRLGEGFLQLRHEDWDEASEFAKIIRYAVVGGQEQPFYLNVSRLYDQTFGHGTVVRQYNPNINYNTTRVGATLDFNRQAVGVQAMVNDLIRPDVLGLMAFVRPFRPTSKNVILRSLSIGASWVHGGNVPRSLRYEPGLFTSSFDQPLPQVDPELNFQGGEYAQLHFVGADIEAKLVRTQRMDLKAYLDYQKMLGYGGGLTLGALFRQSYGRPPTQALRARAEIQSFDADYMPNFFDTFHDIFQYQYLPASYPSSNGLTYYPTKLGLLDANRNGRRRIGGYFELTNSFLDLMTLGFALRTWAPVGAPGDPAFVNPTLPDYGKACTDATGDGRLTCPGQITYPGDLGFTSLKLHAELPLRKFLQAFAAYEVFSTSAEPNLGVLRFDGDNEVFFSGARMQLLPILWVEVQARRYFFVQRLSKIDIEAGILEQDQNYHSRWTFALNFFLGYES